MSSLAATFVRTARSLDRVWLAILLTFSVLVAGVPEQAASSLAFTLDSMLTMLPFLLLSVAAAAYVKASGAESLVARAFQGRMLPMIGAAAVLGALSPFCSCGVIPLVAALLAMGVPLPPVMAFWLASPLMDPSMFMVTAGTLGLPFAVAKTAAAVGVGLLGGLGTAFLVRSGRLRQALRPEVRQAADGRTLPSGRVAWRFWSDAARRAAFAEGALRNAKLLAKWLTLAFLLESLMVAYVPAEIVARAVGGEGVVPIVLATLVGIPAYLNGYAALPLVAGLVGQGMSPGAAMAFLVGGGVTSIPAALAVQALVRWPVFLAYLGFALGGSVTVGLTYGLIA